MCEKEGDVETYLEKILYRKGKKERMLTRYVGENIRKGGERREMDGRGAEKRRMGGEEKGEGESKKKREE